MSLQVGFLKGTQAKLNTLLEDIKAGTKKAQAGAFYITEDSNRIYFAQSDTNLQYLNKYITTVATVNDLPTSLPKECVGDFYYVVTGNILCRYDGDSDASGVTGKASWTQVNPDTPDTDTTDRIKSLGISDGVLNTAKDAIEFTLTATEQSYDVKSGKDTGSARNIVTDATFALNKSILDNWYNKANIDLNATVASNKATVKLNGVGAASGNEVTITGGTNVTIEQNGTDGIKISSTDTNTTYSMESPANETKVHLKGSDGEDDVVEFKAGTDLTVSGTTAGQISYSHKDGYLTATSNQVTAAQTPHQNETFNIISGIQTSNGHVTAVNTSTVKLPYISDIKNYTSETASENPTGKISIVVKDGAGDEKTVTSSEQFGLKVGSTLVPLGGDLKAHFYTETEIDNKFANHLKTVNAMVFKGAVPQSGLPSGDDKVSIGDTYIMADGSGSVTQEGTIATTGDILIAYSATGQEEADGYIASANIKWTLVPGNEEDTTYTFSANDNNLILTSNETGDEGQKIAVKGDAAVSLTANDNKLQVTHATTSANGLSTPAGTKVQLPYNDETGFTVVTGVTANKYGHVTGITASKIALPDTHKLAHNATTGATELKDGKAGNVVGSIDIDGTGVITVTSTENTNKNGSNYVVSHNELSKAQKVVPVAPADADATVLTHEGYFTAVTGATRDAYGHVTGYTVSKYKLPVDKDTTYALSGATVAASGTNGVKITDTLTDNVSGNSDSKSEFVLKSENTNLTVGVGTGTAEVTLGLVWGTF